MEIFENMKQYLPCYTGPIPSPSTLLPVCEVLFYYNNLINTVQGKPEDQVIMMRNQIIALHYALNEVRPQDVITEEHLKQIHHLLMRGVSTNKKLGFDEKIHSGAYRTSVLGATGFPNTIYPV